MILQSYASHASAFPKNEYAGGAASAAAPHSPQPYSAHLGGAQSAYAAQYAASSYGQQPYGQEAAYGAQGGRPPPYANSNALSRAHTAYDNTFPNWGQEPFPREALPARAPSVSDVTVRAVCVSGTQEFDRKSFSLCRSLPPQYTMQAQSMHHPAYAASSQHAQQRGGWPPAQYAPYDGGAWAAGRYEQQEGIMSHAHSQANAQGGPPHGPYAADPRYRTAPPATFVGIYGPEERRQRLARFHDKRKKRVWGREGKVYLCRKESHHPSSPETRVLSILCDGFLARRAPGKRSHSKRATSLKSGSFSLSLSLSLSSAHNNTRRFASVRTRVHGRFVGRAVF